MRRRPNTILTFWTCAGKLNKRRNGPRRFSRASKQCCSPIQVGGLQLVLLSAALASIDLYLAHAGVALQKHVYDFFQSNTAKSVQTCSKKFFLMRRHCAIFEDNFPNLHERKRFQGSLRVPLENVKAKY